MSYIKNVIFVVVLILVGVLLFQSFYSKNEDVQLEEEATPIRDGDTITEMNYTITIGKKIKDDSITISSQILDSISHYKEIDSIDSFVVHLKIDNQSSSPYLLKGMRVIDERQNLLIDHVSFQKEDTNSFLIYFSKEFFQNYKSFYKIQIELEK